MSGSENKWISGQNVASWGCWWLWRNEWKLHILRKFPDRERKVLFSIRNVSREDHDFLDEICFPWISRNKIGWTDIKMSYRMRKPRPGCGNRSSEAETASRTRKSRQNNCSLDGTINVYFKSVTFTHLAFYLNLCTASFFRISITHFHPHLPLTWSYPWHSSFKALSRSSSQLVQTTRSFARSFARLVKIINANNN